MRTDQETDSGGAFAPPAAATRQGLSLVPLYAAMIALAILSAVFILFSDLDLRFAALFHDPATGFPASRDPWLGLLRRIGKEVIVLSSVILLASLALKLFRPSKALPIAASRIWFLLASLAIGPGLIVNGILKSAWGRPRPIQVDLFGGSAPFETAWKISGACRGNCSFVSGEAASAIWLLGLIVLAPPRYRPALAVAIGLLVLALSLNRIAFGGHFLSDVLISWAITLVVMLSLHRVMVAGPFSVWLDTATESALRRIALALAPALGRIAKRRPSDRRNGLGELDQPN